MFIGLINSIIYKVLYSLDYSTISTTCRELVHKAQLIKLRVLEVLQCLNIVNVKGGGVKAGGRCCGK